jgi:hypothetical protein
MIMIMVTTIIITITTIAMFFSFMCFQCVLLCFSFSHMFFTITPSFVDCFTYVECSLVASPPQLIHRPMISPQHRRTAKMTVITAEARGSH